MFSDLRYSLLFGICSEVYASYGGLLMQLRGEATILSKDRFAVDSKVYLFIRKG